MKVLITSPRAPISIEWIKIAIRSSYEVILVDSLDYPIGKFFDHHITYIKIPAPRLDFTGYCEQMKILLPQVDLVIPNCEDIFFLSKVREMCKTKALFLMPEHTLLLELHNKFLFQKYLNNYVKFPETVLITDKKEIKEDTNTVLKPVFSRFGRNVIRGVTAEKIKDIVINEEYPWVQQRYIQGKPLCNYAVCQNGKVISQVVYLPKYLLNQSASTYFEYYEDKRIDAFTALFAEQTNYIGQIAFDFIDDGKDLYILECNPRATSGLHLISANINISMNSTLYSVGEIEKRAYRVGKTLFLFFALPALFKGKFKALLSDYKQAKDVLAEVPASAQLFSFYEMIKYMLKYKKSLTDATTFDIEYDGKYN